MGQKKVALIQGVHVGLHYCWFAIDTWHDKEFVNTSYGDATSILIAQIEIMEVLKFSHLYQSP